MSGNKSWCLTFPNANVSQARCARSLSC